MIAKAHDICIRLMTREDLPRILELINLEGWNYHISEIERMLKLSPDTSVVACREDAILGGITAATIGGRCVLGHVVIDGKWRKSGIGSALIATLIANEEQKGVSFLMSFPLERPSRSTEDMAFIM